MKIALINGSPKVNNSASKILLADLKRILTAHTQNSPAEKNEILEIDMHNTVVSTEALKMLHDSDTWVIVCPLYVDGIPAHLLSCLVQLETCDWTDCPIRIHGIVNCGFYEGIQAEFALDILQNWSAKSGLTWGGGIGIGGGGALAQMPSAENGHGPKAPIEKALRAMAGKILRHKENVGVPSKQQGRLRRMGSLKGQKLISEGYDIDESNDEIAKMFGVY